MAGRVDLEVDGRYVFELRTHQPNQTNQHKDIQQLGKCLDSYRLSPHVIDRAAILYVTPEVS